MPLSAIQGRVLRLLAANRSPESYRVFPAAMSNLSVVR